MDRYESLIETLETGGIIRYHNTQIDKKQTIAEHQWGVSLILNTIYFKTDNNTTSPLLLYALVHDCPEVITGDIPAPFKWDNPGVKAFLQKSEDAWLLEHHYPIEKAFPKEWLLALKWADSLEGLWFTTRQARKGDYHALQIRDRWVEAISKYPYLNIKADDMFLTLQELIR